MIANLAASIIKHGQVRTTDAKAKEVRPFIERLVTFARRGDLHARRIVLSRLKGDTEAVRKLFDEIGPRFTSRPGGYTRILKLGFRQGDNSPVSLIEFVDEEMGKKTSRKSKPKKTKTTKRKAEETAPAAAETEVAADTADAAVEVEAEAAADVEEAAETVEEVAAEEAVEETVEDTPAPDDEVKEAPAEEPAEEKAAAASESTEKAEAEPEKTDSADAAEEEKKDDK